MNRSGGLFRSLLLHLITAAALAAVPIAESSSGPVGPATAIRSGEGRVPLDCGWLAPVDAPIVDGFRAPDHPFGPGGNRGLEFATAPGQAVSAVADGVVSFAGPVGGRIWLVVDHPDGLRSSYGPLVAVIVVRGQVLDAGAPVGDADAAFHLTARTAEFYLDPAPLLAGRCGGARLVMPT